MVSDSCHSGGLIDKTKEQIGNSTKQSKIQQRERGTRPPSDAGVRSSLLRILRGAFESLVIHRCGHHHNQSGAEAGIPDAETTSASVVSNRSLPLSTFIEMLRYRTGKHDVGVGSIRTTLFHHFGEEASPKVKRFVKAMVGKLRHEDGKMDLDGGKEPRGGGVRRTARAAAARVAVPRNGVLISGCQTDETSADATTPDGTSYGALSNAIQAILGGKKRGTVTNRELVLKARELLSKEGYTQQPGLYCSDEHAKVPFIC
ncbi:hypothetical protein PR202_ga05549 [Eleusine coracana subsp. coracana]|uniref:Peptidase C14 caspase domain-containing protein n=1 Tax=Eleusine coracana subsp. coracana TaxID=191504 RepID=A0AAV5BTX5_ELECO|nr:hypothetical protein PR202_ga05096 [Eleusine coracana subsp. coracana]GJM89363.1 hypothetical protein PR202_ga05549 [Eleusine coracana subsp. coracana]